MPLIETPALPVVYAYGARVSEGSAQSRLKLLTACDTALDGVAVALHDHDLSVCWMGSWRGAVSRVGVGSHVCGAVAMEEKSSCRSFVGDARGWWTVLLSRCLGEVKIEEPALSLRRHTS